MKGQFQNLPLMISIPGVIFALMIIPTAFGFWHGENLGGRTFLYSMILGGVGIAVLALALATTPISTTRYVQLGALVGYFLGLPALLAVPMMELIPNKNFFLAYLDSVSVMTTTGLPVFAAEDLGLAVQIWRGLLGWVSGFFMWVFAWSIFAPMNIGGFEHLNTSQSQHSQTNNDITPAIRFWREFVRLAPIYIWITLIAALVMMVLGTPPAYAISRAMGAIATFGFEIETAQPEPGFQTYMGEAVIACVFVFALSRSCFSKSLFKFQKYEFWHDPELRMAASIIAFVVIIIPLTLALRGSNILGLVEVLRNLWSIVFTALSYLTTTGYAAADWVGVQVDLGLGPTGMILAGLAIFGGGVGTTAGGIKLLRVYVLIDHSRGEIDKLISPSQVTRTLSPGLKKRSKNAELAWVFFMVFALVFAAIVLALCASGLGADAGLQLAVATITNTGPLVTTFGTTPDVVQSLNATSKAILVISMVFGRLELLAFLALLNPNMFR